jgi:hypothetical protein
MGLGSAAAPVLIHQNAVSVHCDCHQLMGMKLDRFQIAPVIEFHPPFVDGRDRQFRNLIAGPQVRASPDVLHTWNFLQELVNL